MTGRFKRYFLAAALLTAGMAAWLQAAPSSRRIYVGNNQPYTDNISLSADTRDLDVMVKVSFDEDENTLTVSLISYRDLFVFREPVRYKNTIKFRKLKTNALPYDAEIDPHTVFKLRIPYNEERPPHKNRYVFNRWIAYTGMTPQDQDYKLVNETIEQVFDVKPGRSKVSFTLRDIIVMEPKARQSKKKFVYDFVFWKDLNLRYTVDLKRNPCIGKEQAIAEAKAALQGVREGVALLRDNFPGGKTDTKEKLKAFNSVKKTLSTQYRSHRTDNVACSDEREVWQQYNRCVDSLLAVKCVYVAPPAPEGEKPAAKKDEVSLAKLFMSQARTLDRLSTQYLQSKDFNEKRAIKKQGDKIVADVQDVAKERSFTGMDQKKAYAFFQQAVKYFKSVTDSKDGQ